MQNELKYAPELYVDSGIFNGDMECDVEGIKEKLVKCIEKWSEESGQVGVEDQRVIELLQKYWDLRLSEATEFVGDQKEENERIARKGNTNETTVVRDHIRMHE